MATVLEFGKLVSAAWLHYEWDRINNLVRAYFTFAVIVLMLITSMGIFGYLSKAHIEQTIQVGGNNQIRIEIIEKKIARQNAIVQDAETVLAQLDGAVATLQEYDRIRGADGAIAVRQSQSEEREALNKVISDAYDSIESLQTEMLPLRKEQLDLQAEIGPLKYIAELIYGDEAENYFDDAVRWIIISIIFVFDPLAIMLLIISTGAFKRDKLKIKPLVNENQIMRMDIDDRDNTDKPDFLSESKSDDTTKFGEPDSKENDSDNAEPKYTTGDDVHLQSEWHVGIDGSEVQTDKSSAVKEKREGNLYTTMARRPV